MVDHLEEVDSVSVVTYSGTATVLAEGISGANRAELIELFEGIVARGNTNLFDGLATAFRVADENREPANQTRVIFLSDGVATAGLRQTGRLESLARAYAKRGIGITTIGVGRDFDVEAMRSVSEVGAGNFYFLEDPLAVEEVFSEEIKTFLVPVALDVKIEVDAGDGYIIRQVYGTNDGPAVDGAGPSRFPVSSWRDVSARPRPSKAAVGAVAAAFWWRSCPATPWIPSKPQERCAA